MNNIAKIGVSTGSVALFLDFIPAQYAIYPAGLIILCVVLSAAIEPPLPASRWTGLYQIMTALAGNVGWATNHIRPVADTKPPPDAPT
ncbi:hypothetical protein J2D73_12525 [Acetobacter sacchari]|uniref:Holin n=1 Tax=Acetobacter sacchari TaxID=2661687 RepID=A0ABS3LXH9_9PROT|nr:hypothetical protein [Acetobacter sacchari]MBO1360613.1 hypothetical protein [Acetobacter sacchari]